MTTSRRFMIPRSAHRAARALAREVLASPSRLRIRIHRHLDDASASGFALPAVHLAMPSALEQRLRRIAREEVSCDAVERLYPSAERRRGERDPAVERHLEHCTRCRDLFGGLEVALRAARHEPSAEQLLRWREIARQPTTSALPRWLRDGGFVVAASLIVTVLLSLPLGGPSSESWQDLDRGVSQTAAYTSSWLDSGETASRQLWTNLRSRLASDFERGRASLVLHSRSYTKIYNRTLDLFGLDEPDRRESFLRTQGERYG